ncbi:helix-turn-helix domain-containing protein [Companilactobacillus baiquanensis]|uniref:Helix-turn-helix domain-containing protein n=1 Tax=Companilactobacillus baiquanensis TaxID=2486005 RepID=A0ABW1UZW1_9LACO|nr:helix-turn-helix domain-containing protein [Companilactobacillus baiquanensis]
MAKSSIDKWTTPEGLLEIEGWARDGLTDEQIAHNIGIVPSTLYEWKKKKSEISESLKKGKSVVDREVENALFKRAIGFKSMEEQYRVVPIEDEIVEVRRRDYANKWKLKHPDASSQEIQDAAVKGVKTSKRVKLGIIEKDVPPDTTAAIFWLKNRKPDDWRDKHETELSGGLNVHNPYANLTDEELKKLANEQK